MGNIDGNRNFGYGRQPAWAGKNALADRYGQGHFGTRATHEERWCQFVRYLRQVNSGKASVAYAQNFLSTVNAIREAMRKDTLLKSDFWLRLLVRWTN